MHNRLKVIGIPAQEFLSQELLWRLKLRIDSGNCLTTPTMFCFGATFEFRTDMLEPPKHQIQMFAVHFACHLWAGSGRSTTWRMTSTPSLLSNIRSQLPRFVYLLGFLQDVDVACVHVGLYITPTYI